MRFSKFACCLAILFSACMCFAQMYTVIDLGTLGGTGGGGASVAYAINNSGQAAGYALTSDPTVHAIRTAPNATINAATDDLGGLGGFYPLDPLHLIESEGYGVNASGQVV